MKKPGYYSTGEFMKLTHITKKTIRYYDEHNILKPSFVDENTHRRFYTDSDLAKLHQILLLKTLGFSLNDIREITIRDEDSHFMVDSLNLQLKLVEERIEQLQIVAQTIKDTTKLIGEHKEVNWSHSLDLIHSLGMETHMKNQYENSSNISARINLHVLYSKNKEGWFPWIFNKCNIKPEMKILEVGCGDGTFWLKNLSKLPEDINIVLSDISEGMLRDARRTLGATDRNFSFKVCSCESLPFEDNSFDLIIANHVLFYCDDIKGACSEIKRVLKKDGCFLSSTYGKDHMKEIRELVFDFDDRIILSAEELYNKFGKENGSNILGQYFSQIQWTTYEDSLMVPEPEPVISYVLSCHGNQNQYILDHYKEFHGFVKNKTKDGFHITKEAGIFTCRK